MGKPLIIAFYLPQFHPFPENDEWWGKGFTEWTNVGKAKPLFKGHNQPRVPTELGYYDLRLPIVREQQAELAKIAGVSAFCYWHYWFGNGKRLLSDVFDEVLATGKPDFPFCLGWANHNWMAKNWNASGIASEKILMEQQYPGIEDEKMHFDYLKKAFLDPRYLKIDNKPILYIFDSKALPTEYIVNFRRWTKDAGFDDLILVGKMHETDTDIEEKMNKGFNYVSFEQKSMIRPPKYKGEFFFRSFWNKVRNWIYNRPLHLEDYEEVYPTLLRYAELENVCPVLLPQWDHSPRSGRDGGILYNATPDNFFKHAVQVLECVRKKKTNNQIIFLKSWNEWGEGNMMEPDLTYGRGFINALKKALDEYCTDQNNK